MGEIMNSPNQIKPTKKTKHLSMILLLYYIYTLEESTRITRGSGTWSCHPHYLQTIGINSYMSDDNRNELFNFLLRQISSLQVGDSHNWYTQH